MNEKERQDIGLFRYSLIIEVNQEISNGLPIGECFRRVVEKKHMFNGIEVSPAVGTLERWYYNYRKSGFDSILPVNRSDYGTARRLSEDARMHIRNLIEEYPKTPATVIYQKLIEVGTITKLEVSASTINRYVNQIKKDMKVTNNKDMRRYERANINDVWCGDTSHGPWITIDKKKYKVYIIALIDDASRMITGIDVFLNDNTANLIHVIQKAVAKHGVPKIFNFDNGRNYKNRQIQLIGARIGTSINYCAPYTPVAKAKIER